MGLDTFYQYLFSGYPKLTSLAAKILSMFRTTYLCKQTFSVINLNKTKHCSRLTNGHFNDIVKCAVTQDLRPDIDVFVNAKRCQMSGASTVNFGYKRFRYKRFSLIRDYAKGP